MNLIDLLLIIFLFLGLLKGFKKGLLNSLVGLLSCLVGLFVAIKASPYVAVWLETKFQLTAKVAQYFEKRLALSEAVSQLKIGSLPLADVNALGDSLSSLPEQLRTQLLDFAQKIGEQMGQAAEANLGDVLYLFLAEIVVKIVVIILIWFIIDKGLCFCACFLTKLTENTFLGFLNKCGGVCIGLLIRVLTLTIVIGLSSPLFNLARHTEPSFLSTVLQTISEAQLVPYFTALFSLLTGRLLFF
ncbi:MAG: CvpA family protein [Clostridia bacterium]|jgi:uncharacterized membrane protein required for colicin V production|nr:CvpA family protein [Clostridia bacterium]